MLGFWETWDPNSKTEIDRTYRMVENIKTDCKNQGND